MYTGVVNTHVDMYMDGFVRYGFSYVLHGSGVEVYACCRK